MPIDGEPCEDNDNCTLSSVCNSGFCVGETFLDCDDRARLIACDGSIAEVYTAWDECNASEVCTDPAE